MAQNPNLRDGRFPANEIISLLDVNRRFNLAESTSQDLTLGEVLDLAGVEQIRSLKLGYGSSAGLLALREAIARHCGVSADQVLTTQGTVLGLYLLATELCRAGDEAVLATPCFPPTRDALIGSGVVVRTVPLRFDEAYRLDVERMVSAMSPRTRLVSIASPQNPSGVRTDRGTVERLLAAMKERAPDAFLFVDETYRDAIYGDAETPRSMAAIDPRVVTGASVSKAHGAPGLRTGWLTVADIGLLARLKTAKMNVVISGSTLDETLAAVVLTRGEAVLAPRRRLLARALAELASWYAGEAHRLDWVRPDGGALCCMRLAPHAFDDGTVRRFWEVLPALELQLASGRWFGEEDCVFRLGFGYLPEAELAPALAAVSRAMDAALAG